MEKRGKKFLARFKQKLDKLIAAFGDLPAWQESYATTIFVDRDHAKNAENVSLDELAEEVAQLKPRHDKHYTATVVKDLHKKGYLRSTLDSSSDQDQ